MSEVTIKRIFALEVLDSRGNPTVQAGTELSDRRMTRATVASGASTGVHEAVELRDGDSRRYNGKGVLAAVRNVNEIIGPALVGLYPIDPFSIDERIAELDQSGNFSVLGANATSAVSMACVRAGALVLGDPLYRHIAVGARVTELNLPVPFFNFLNGGKHGPGGLPIQEIMAAPFGAMSFGEAIRWGAEIRCVLKGVLKDRGLGTAIGDEAGFVPGCRTTDEALDLLEAAIRQAGFEPISDVAIAIDAAASEFYEDGRYKLEPDLEPLPTDQAVLWWVDLLKRYRSIVSVEDPFDQDDFLGWSGLTTMVGTSVQIVGDDLYVTNAKRINAPEAEGCANALLVKLNQVGTFERTLRAVEAARARGQRLVASHRSGESGDPFLADLAVGLGAEFIKAGAPARERIVIYNRLVEIEDELGPGLYPGWKALAPGMRRG